MNVNKQEIMSGMEDIMQIAMCYCHPNVPDIDDWHAVHSIVETIYDELKKGEDDE